MSIGRAELLAILAILAILATFREPFIRRLRNAVRDAEGWVLSDVLFDHQTKLERCREVRFNGPAAGPRSARHPIGPAVGLERSV